MGLQAGNMWIVGRKRRRKRVREDKLWNGVNA